MPGLPASMVAPDATPLTIEARVVAKEALSQGVIGLCLEPADSEEVPPWEPGAHVDLHLPGGAVRQYSLCGRVEDRGVLRVAVVREDLGRGGSRFLHDDLAVGDVIAISAPRNNFAFGPAARCVFIAGGIGITPMLPMLAAARTAGVEWSLVYGGRSRASMAFLPELEPLPEVTIVPEDEAGLLDLDVVVGAPQPDTIVYCCGPEPLLLAVEACMSRWPPGALRVERFKPRADIAEPSPEPFTVVLRRSGLELVVHPGHSILGTVAAAGVPVPSSCQEGTCGTCETIVIEGEPDHRDSVLGQADREANDCMMICVSRACSPRLVLDL